MNFDRVTQNHFFMRMGRLLTAALLLNIIFYSNAQGGTLMLIGSSNRPAGVSKFAGGLYLCK
jgi:hypothetical protein